MDEHLLVTVNTPYQLFYKGPADAVSSVNTSGKFDILMHHANFITIIEKRPIVVAIPNQKPVTFNFDQAIIYCHDNQVYVFAEPFSLQKKLKI